MDDAGDDERPYVGGRGPAEDIVVLFVADSAKRGEVPGWRRGDPEQGEDGESGWLDLISSKGEMVRSFEVRHPDDRDAVADLARDVVDAAADDLVGCDLPRETFLVRFRDGIARKTFTLRIEQPPAPPPPPSLVLHRGGSLSGREADVDDYDRRRRAEQDLDTRISVQMTAAALDAHSQVRELPRDLTAGYQVLLERDHKTIAWLSAQLEKAQAQVNQLHERYFEVIQRSNEVDTVKNEHELKLKEQDRKAAREKHAWDTAKGLLPHVLPFVMARFGGQAGAMAQAFSGGGSPFPQNVGSPFPHSAGQAPGAPPFPGASVGGQEQADGYVVEEPPQPPPGFADGIPGLGGINMQVVMQMAPVVVEFLTGISDDQVVEIAESEDGVVHLTPGQRRALLVLRKLFGSARTPAG